MITVRNKELESLIEKSKSAERKRALQLFRSSEHGEVPAIMYNAFQPGTYVQPHKHPEDGKEIWIANRGTIRTILFDENGEITGHWDVSPSKIVYLEIPAQTYHTAIALEPDSMMCELYMDIYNPQTYKTFAPWAPSENDGEKVSGVYLSELIKKTG